MRSRPPWLAEIALRWSRKCDSLNISGGKKISGPGEFQRNYEKIITPEVVKAVSEQDFGKVFVNQQGVMIGSGQVWLSGQCLDQACTKTEVKVITIQ